MRVRSEDLGGPAASGTAVHLEVVSCSYGSRSSNTLEKFYDIPERWLDIHWDKDGTAYHVGRINIVCGISKL